ncbi:MAG TPA: deiodinase-like protein [Terriglobales bacterium]|nr:deiodinase-like protein [Terriglobales bacterium]
MLGFGRYNYESFKSEFISKAGLTRFSGGPEPGDAAPDFEGYNLEGEKVALDDFRGEQNLVLSFGSATCPATAASIGPLNELYEEYKDSDEVAFVFVYVREAHPGEKLPGHRSFREKVRAAELFREEEYVDIPILVDSLEGRIHRAYGKAPNPTYVIDKSGHIAFRCLWTQADVIADALEALVEDGAERAVVEGGEDTSLPVASAVVHTHRALERGGERAIENFRSEMGRPGRLAETASRVMGPIAMHPERAIAGAAIAAGVIAAGLFAGFRLRQARCRRSQDPYRYASGGPGDDSDDGYAVGI